MTRYQRIYFLIFFIFLYSAIQAQDLEKIDKKDLVNMGGGISVSTVMYDVDGVTPRRDPFYWQVQANVNFNIGEISMPFSATFSQQERSYTQPYNQIGISPKYKAVTAHIGYRSMNFSQYTLGGRVFLGGGVEIKPKNYWIQGSAMYGRLARAVQTGGNDGIVAGEATYERWGFGGNIRFGNDNNNLALTIFKGKDDPNSITVDSTNSYITPAENLVWSLYTKQKLAKRFSFDFEYAFSGYTRDIRNKNDVLENFNYYNNLGGLFSPNATTQYNKAIVTNLNYAHEKYNLKFSYKRIDPEYQSMGTPFLNNDMENITAGVSWKMFKKLMSITTTGGFQRNNLSNLKASKETRLAFGANINYIFKKKLTLGLNYSNFSSNVYQQQFVEVDSLNFFQVTNNVSFRSSYKLKNDKKKKQDLIYSVNYQKANDSEGKQTTIVNNNFGYKHSIKTIGLNLFISFNYNVSAFTGLESKTYGPMLNASKNILKNKVSLRFTYNNLYRESASIKQNSISNYRFAVQYTYKKRHAFSINANLLDRKSFLEGQDSFLEKTLTFQYNFRF